MSTIVYYMERGRRLLAKTAEAAFCLALVVGCQGKAPQASHPETAAKGSKKVETKRVERGDTAAAVVKGRSLADFVPKGYSLTEKHFGDLNGDGVNDCVLIIKARRKDAFVLDETRGLLDRNRRGVMVLLNKGGRYEPVVENRSCFSSENEDGGVYYAPILMVEIRDNKLYFFYEHGRYGNWEYCFRSQDSDMVLIGYESLSARGPVTLSTTSVNFLTRVKKISVNVNEEAEEEGDEKYETQTVRLPRKPLIRLSEVKDFDDLDLEPMDDSEAVEDE